MLHRGSISRSSRRSSLAKAALVAAALAASGLVACVSAPSSDPQAVLRAAEAAMGGDKLKSIAFAGSGTGALFGQALQPGMAWPKLNYSNLARIADYENGALREDFALSRAEPSGGGGTPLMGQGEQRGTGLVMGGFAWNMAGPAPLPAPVAHDIRVHDLWTTPHGVLKAAAKNSPRVAVTQNTAGAKQTTLSFTMPGAFSATAVLNAANLVERIESRHPHPVTGDTDVVTTFSDYRDHGGVKFPARIRQSKGGFEVLDLAVSSVTPNAPANVTEVPALVRAFAERASTEKVAEGVWFVAGGSHNSVAVEMADHLLLVESPLYDGRAAAVLAAVKALAPGKPIRYVVNSHHHFDHSGGLRSAVADGATLVTSAAAKPYFERVFANANSISPDLLARSGRKATVLAVDGKLVMNDSSRSVEIHQMQGSIHAQGFQIVYLPKEKLLIEADAFTPGAPNSPPPAVVNDNHANLVQNIERLGLNVERILPLHGRVVPLAVLHTAIGRR